MGIKTEKYYPVCIAGSLTIIAIWQKGNIPPIQKAIDAVMVHVFDVYSILIGFLLTILTIVKSMEGKTMDAIRSKKARFNQLTSYLIASITMDAVMVLFCLIMPFAPKEFPVVNDIINYLFIFILLYSLLASYRFLDIFFAIIKGE